MTEIKKLSKEMIEALKAPFPAEAITPNPKKTFLSSIKAYYIIERLNEVFGVGTWQLRDEIIGTEKVNGVNKEGKPTITYEVLAKATLDIPEYNIHLEQAGGSDDKVWGDSAKGAITDALNKCASYLYIGYDVFMGRLDQKVQQPAQAAPAPQKKFFDFNIIKQAKSIAELEKIYHEEVETMQEGKCKSMAIQITKETKERLLKGASEPLDQNLIYND